MPDKIHFDLGFMKGRPSSILDFLSSVDMSLDLIFYFNQFLLKKILRISLDNLAKYFEYFYAKFVFYQHNTQVKFEFGYWFYGPRILASMPFTVREFHIYWCSQLGWGGIHVLQTHSSRFLITFFTFLLGCN